VLENETRLCGTLHDVDDSDAGRSVIPAGCDSFAWGRIFQSAGDPYANPHTHTHAKAEPISECYGNTRSGTRASTEPHTNPLNFRQAA
jgi:hypothetical protein